MSRRKIILILVGIFLILPLILFGLYMVFWNPTVTTVGKETVYTDKDTGESVSTFSGINPERDGNPEILILGLTELSGDVMRAHFVFIKEQINTYSAERLKNAYDIITLLPESYTNDGQGNISGTLRLGKEGNQTVQIDITASRFTGEVRVVITDPTNMFGGVYDSGPIVHEAD